MVPKVQGGVDQVGRLEHQPQCQGNTETRLIHLKLTTRTGFMRPSMVEGAIQQYFQKLFTHETDYSQIWQVPNGFTKLQQEHHTILLRSFTKEEIKNAFFDNSPFKALCQTTFMQASFKKHGTL